MSSMQQTTPKPQGLTATAEAAKAVQEIQASLVIAKAHPRDENVALDRILKSCTRKSLAEQGLYAYKRGNQTVTGPSIRLAEAMAQSWGNLQMGVRELEQVTLEDGSPASIARAYAWDMETNTKVEKEFIVPHKRFTKSGAYQLTDPRDIYETIANNGARRLRACILGVIPGDVTDEAVAAINKTLAASDDRPIEERIKAVIKAFDPFKVTKNHIEGYLGHNMEATTDQEFVNLRAILKSLKDGHAKPGAYFNELAEEEGSQKAGALNAALDAESKAQTGKPRPETDKPKKKPAKGKAAQEPEQVDREDEGQ